ncbi:pyridoxine-5'-phosphate oxidase [Folsomia candida]|uniref:pyridoxal 5'-phosphate synthase n=1 Tax=Folsomia candida TaxID=158441 RepID=A0A226EEP0_FOLCA|nr:pyridoxine-5'-phosphate oxidase [Folsomia candida]OXA55859.1 Pyridoxine-5'-phosphate oxidase [Folsomia candida]
MRRLLAHRFSLPLATAALGVGIVTASSSILNNHPQRRPIFTSHCAPKINKPAEAMSEENIPGLYSQDKLRSMSINITGMRIPYHGKNESFTEDQLVAREPFSQFNNWFERAAITEGIEEPNAMCLATATKDGKPSCRMVLLKGYGIDGFKFFTNYCSRKGRELEENPWVSLNFYWEPMKRCIRVEGRVERLSVEESTEYFHSRPISSQVGAAISPQSQPVPGREFLLEKEKELLANVGENKCVDKPETWGGFVVIPDVIEFWQGQTNRIHDRIRFRKRAPGECPDNVLVHEGENGWVFERLAP